MQFGTRDTILVAKPGGAWDIPPGESFVMRHPATQERGLCFGFRRARRNLEAQRYHARQISIGDNEPAGDVFSLRSADDEPPRVSRGQVWRIPPPITGPVLTSEIGFTLAVHRRIGP